MSIVTKLGKIMVNTEKYNLEFRNDEGEFLKLCVDLTIYWKGSVFDHVEGILDFYEQVLKVITKDVKYYTTETMEGARKIKADTLELVPFWFSKSKKKRGLYILSLEGGEQADILSDIGFYLCADEESDVKTGTMRLILPADYASQPQEFVEMVRSLVRKLDFESGHAGFAVNWFPTADSADDALGVFPIIARRYPGIDLSDIDITLYAISSASEPGIKCINWLTLLGANLFTSIGGIESLRKQLPNDCPIYELDNGGGIIQAGKCPDIGDKNSNTQLSAYKAVGHILAPLRLQEHPDFIGATSTMPYEDITTEWLARFD